MATLGYIQNGITKRRAAKKRNGVKSLSKSRVKSFLKKNGLKAVSMKAVANPKRRKRHTKRRNGLRTITATRRNGLLGNTKSDAKNVLSLGAGALGTKGLGRILAGFVAPYLSKFGVGAYTEAICDGVIALFVAPIVGGKLGGKNAGDMARLGGLLTVALDVVEIVAPNALSYNPFNTSPIVVNQNGAGVSPAAVAQIAAGIANSANPNAEAAKVAGVMAALDSAGAQSVTGGSVYAGAPELVL